MRTLILASFVALLALPAAAQDMDTLGMQRVRCHELRKDGKTEEELYQERLTSAGCAGCHVLMDPLGKAYSNFDAAGLVTGTPTVVGAFAVALSATDGISGADIVNVTWYADGRSP